MREVARRALAVEQIVGYRTEVLNSVVIIAK